MDNIEGNVSTIGVMIWTILCPYISTYVSQDVFLAIFGLLIVVWSAYNPNTLKFFGNNKSVKEINPKQEYEDMMNAQYEDDGLDDI